MHIHRSRSQQGFHLIAALLAIVAIGTISLIGYIVTKKQPLIRGTAQPKASTPHTEDSTSEPVVWAFDEQKLHWYVKAGGAPDCAEPFMFSHSPTDLSKVTAAGMPGAYRGYSYKPHGGFRLDDSTGGKTGVVLPADATLTNIKRYYEGSPAEIQYLLSFEMDCGIAFRFDHLRSLTPELQSLAETTPEPKLDDTRTDPNIRFQRTGFTAGTLVATEVGHLQSRNYGFDFGVYDYRSRNAIAGNRQWSNLHAQYQATEWYGRCWSDMLPGQDAGRAKTLSLTVVNPNRPNLISDYCSYAPYKTLDFNDGKPTDG